MICSASSHSSFLRPDHHPRPAQVRPHPSTGGDLGQRLTSAPEIRARKEPFRNGRHHLWSVHVPAKTPRPICDKLEAWFNTIAVEPDVVAFNAAVASDVLPGNSQSLKALLLKQTKAWHEYARLARIVPE